MMGATALPGDVACAPMGAGMDLAEGHLLEIRDVSKHWPGAPGPVLDSVSLTVGAGRAVAITGHNGAGKTTLLRIASGLIAPDAGSVAVSGLHPERDRRAFQRQIGFLSAGNSGLYARLKVEHHLDYWARLALIPKAERRAAVDAVIERFALDELSGKRVDRLSMGQRQRLRLSLAFLHEPNVVLLDEPATSLDDQGAAIVQAAADEVLARGGSIVVCTPTSELSRLRFDAVYLVESGRLEAA
jgi:ABC-2 type transport system ATP-binding protein